MKERKWDDFDSAKDILEAAMVSEEPEADAEEQKASGSKDKSRVTELRRRIEERLDSKRIALECDYLELEDLSDEIDDPFTTLQ
jgi:hypothetical protein